MSDDLNLQKETMEENEDTQYGKYLTFVIGDEEYGIGIRHVTEIIGIQRITDMPDVVSYIKGVINLRGKVIPVIDIRLRFGLPEREYDERTCIVVVHFDGTAVGLIVDSVSEVIDIPDEEIEHPPQVNRGSGSQFIEGLGKVGQEVKILLNIHRLLYEEDLDKIASKGETTKES